MSPDTLHYTIDVESMAEILTSYNNNNCILFV